MGRQALAGYLALPVPSGDNKTAAGLNDIRPSSGRYPVMGRPSLYKNEKELRTANRRQQITGQGTMYPDLARTLTLGYRFAASGVSSTRSDRSDPDAASGCE